MKLYNILNNLILENNARQDVINAINNRNLVNIYYDDEDSNHSGQRTIEVYNFGMSRSGNLVIRAYQVAGDTSTFQPSWKLFRLDRITRWEPSNLKFNTPRPNYNRMGDNSMMTVYNTVKF